MSSGVYIRTRVRDLVIKQCLQCDKDIKTRRPLQKFCSSRCANKYIGPRRKLPISDKKVEFICRSCGKLFPYYKMGLNKRKYCSVECYHRYRSEHRRKPKLEVRKCQKCEEIFECRKRSSRRYCSVCQYKGNKKQPSLGQVRFCGDGYRQIYIGKNHPMAYHDGWALEHRVIVSQNIGRPLTRLEVVHHLDKHKLNNSDENLVLKTPGTHRDCLNCPLAKEIRLLKWQVKELQKLTIFQH